jgi:Tol biopolymer transport system component
VASFSGQWRDLEPTMAPDGSSLIFVSSRPIDASARPLDLVIHGTVSPGRGLNLWRVNREGAGWSEPIRLPETVNRSARVSSPSIAGDGSLYFAEMSRDTGTARLLRSQYRDGTYQAAVPVSFGDETTEDVDPAVAPDESFIVFSTKPAADRVHPKLAIALRDGARWGAPIALDDILHADGGGEARLGPDHRTLYFSGPHTTAISLPRTRAQAALDLQRILAWDNGSQNIWWVSLSPWLDARRSP